MAPLMPQLQLVCLGNDPQPGQISRYLITLSQKLTLIDVVRTDQGPFTYREVREDTTPNDDAGVVARFQSQGPRLVLEPFVENISVEPPISWKLRDRYDVAPLVLPQSTPSSRCLIVLRPDDIVGFEDDGLKIRILAGDEDVEPTDNTLGTHIEAAAREPTACVAEVHVQSSDLGADKNPGVSLKESKPEDECSDSETDDDLDLNQAADEHVRAEHQTPHNPRLGSPVIRETPTQVYSTAPNVAAECDQSHGLDGADLDGQESPLQRMTAAVDHKTSDDDAGESQVVAQESLLEAIDSTPSSPSQASPQSADDASVKLVRCTYSKKRAPKAAKSSRNGPHTKDAIDDDDALSSDVAQIAVSDPGSGSTENAARGARKRPNDHATHNEPDQLSGSKRRKTQSPAQVSSPVSRAGAISDIGETPSMSKTQPSKSKKRAPTSSRDYGVGGTRQSGSPSSIPTSSPPSKISKLVLSRTTVDKAMEKWLSKQGVHVVDDVPNRRTHFVCIVPDKELKKTPKVLRCLLAGKPVLTEDWLTKSKSANELLDPMPFSHEDLDEVGLVDRRTLFTGKVLLFTNALVKQYQAEGWSDIQAIAKDAGAHHVAKCSVAKDGPLREDDNGEQTMFFGCSQGDDDVASLVLNHSRTVFHRDFLTHSIVAGELRFDDEQLKLSVNKAPPAKSKMKDGKR